MICHSQLGKKENRMKVFVYGASGTVGQNLVNELLESGHEVFAGTRDPKKKQNREQLHWIEADPSKPTLGLDVLDKVEALFLLSPPGLTNQYEILSPWIEKAKVNKIQKVVLMTAMGVEFAPEEAPFRKTEILLEKSGLQWNIIRPNWFSQNFNTFWISGILKDQKIYFPGGKAKASFIDARDISSVAKVLLTTNEYSNKAFNLTGKEAIDHDEAAQYISSATGKKIEYVDITPEDFYKALVGVGLSEDYSKFLVMIAGALKEGFAAPIHDSVKSITGKDPISFKAYAEDYKSHWQ